MIHLEHLLLLADAYLAGSQVEEKTLSFRVFGDSKKLRAMRAGADITVRRFNEAISWFAGNWPEGIVWPEGVERPRTIGAAA